MTTHTPGDKKGNKAPVGKEPNQKEILNNMAAPIMMPQQNGLNMPNMNQFGLMNPMNQLANM